jgi:hypothetical protein
MLAFSILGLLRLSITTLLIQIWGFEEVNGERHHVRRIHFIGPKDEHIQARLVYDLREFVLLMDCMKSRLTVLFRRASILKACLYGL